MIDQGSYILGVFTGSIPTMLGAIIVVYAMRSDMRRLRRRLNGIVTMAKEIDLRWTRRTLTTNDWNDMIAEIQPYEEV